MRAIKRFVLVLMIFWASSSAEEYDNDEQQFDASVERTGDNAELTDGNPEQADYADYEDSAEYDNASETKSDYQYSYSYQVSEKHRYLYQTKELLDLTFFRTTKTWSQNWTFCRK